MNSKEYMEKTEQYVLHTYNRFPVVLEKGDGVYLTDADGKFADPNINLQFARNSVNENTEIKLKSSALSLKISDDIPYLGGTTLKFDLPLQAPVVFSCTEDKIQLGVNLKLND